ncbi:MAG: sulfite exporter TauE/SafE family protein [Pseudomonadota bacterium]
MHIAPAGYAGAMPALDPMMLIAVAAIFVGGGIVKGAMGFGLPLVTIAILPFFLPVEAALAVNALVLLVTNLYQLHQSRSWRPAFQLAAPMLVGLVIATPLGAVLATQAPRTLVLGLLGALIITFSTLQLAGLPRPAEGTPSQTPGRLRGFAIGIAAGIVGALTSAPGPVFVMHFAAQRLARPLFMGTLGLLMGCVGAVLALSLAAAGVFDENRLLLALVAMPAAFAGFALGDRLGRRFSVEGFRKAVLVLLCLLGAAMIQRALTA